MKALQHESGEGALAAPDFDLRDYLLPGLQAGIGFGVEVKMLVWINAGSGEVLFANRSSLGLDLRASLFGRERTKRVRIALDPPQMRPAGEVSGQCSLAIGRQIDGDARYTVEKGRFLAQGHLRERDVSFAVRREGRYCLVDLTQPRSLSLRLTFDGSEV